MQESVLLCISTLLDGSNHYSKMFELNGEDGQPLFKQIAITLVCGKLAIRTAACSLLLKLWRLHTDDCKKTDHPDRCTHKLASRPRWISSQKVETVRTLLSEDPAMLLRETLGLSADGSTKAYRNDDVEGFFNAVPYPLTFNPRRMQENQVTSGHPPFAPLPRRRFPSPAVRVFRGRRSVRGRTFGLFNLQYNSD